MPLTQTRLRIYHEPIMRRRHSSRQNDPTSDQLQKSRIIRDVAEDTIANVGADHADCKGLRSAIDDGSSSNYWAFTLISQKILRYLQDRPMIALVGAFASLLALRSTWGPTILQQSTFVFRDTQDFGFLKKPRFIRLHSQEKLTLASKEESALLSSMREKAIKREIYISEETLEARKISMLDSDDNPEYKKTIEPMYTDDPPCGPQYDWQLLDLPVCNLLHEMDLTDIFATLGRSGDHRRQHIIEKIKYLASGGYRDVFMVRGNDPEFSQMALKTLKYTRNYTINHYDRHRRDATVAEHLTSVPTSVDIYAYCGNSAIYQFAKGGNLKDAIDKSVAWDDGKKISRTWNSTQMLQIAYHVAEALADVHNVDMEGRASIAHTDVSADQFVSVEGKHIYKINDFNRARLIRWNHVNNTACPFFVKSNKGKNRSPEEYKYEAESEKVDVYSMGNVIFFITTGEPPFLRLSKKFAKKAVIKGTRPDFGKLTNSSDLNIQALIEAANMCWIQDPEERASARQVQEFLASLLPPQR